MKHAFYTTLATYYDRIYHYIDYEKQVLWIDNALKRGRISNDDVVIDAACGTGTHVAMLTNRGYKIRGIDASIDMINVAKQKYPQEEFKIELMQELSSEVPVGAILCMFNSILYVQPKEAFRLLLKKWFDVLKPGGLVIFDTVDKTIGINSASEEYLYKDIDCEIIFRPRWQYVSNSDILNLFVEFVISDNGVELNIHDHHEMCALSIKETQELMREIGFHVETVRRAFEGFEGWDGIRKSALMIGRKAQ